jgi:hypothetical protein
LRAIADRLNDRGISSPRANNDKIIDVSIHGMITVNDDQRFHDAVQAIDETRTVLGKA